VLSDGSREVPPDLATGDLVGLSPPATSTATTTPSAAVGAIAAGTYRYKVTYVQADGEEGPPSAVVGPLTTTGTAGVDRSIQLGNLPAVTAGFATRNIYRTDASGTGSYRLVGTTAAGATFTDTAAAGTTVLDESTLAQGNYGYYVTFHNSATGLESRPTTLIGPQSLTVDGRRIEITNIPSPTTADYDEIRIYRSLSTSDTQFYRLATLPTGTTSYVDSASDASITNPLNLINLEGPPISTGLLLVDIVQRDGISYNRPFEVGTLEFEGRKGGRALRPPKELEVTATTTVADLLNFFKQANGIQDANADPGNPITGSPGGSVNTSESRLRIESNVGTANAVDISLSSLTLETATGTSQLNLGFSSTQQATGESAVSDFVVYDALGIQLDVRVTAVLEARNDSSTTYRWFADSGGNDPASGVNIAVGTGQIVFDGEGNVSDITQSVVNLRRDNVSSASPLEFNLDFTQLSGLAATKSTLAATRQDGSGAGTLSSYIIGEDGRIRGVFSNGVTRDLGQIRLARFANNTGLEQRGENLFASGINSGLPIEGDPGEQGIGSIIAGATELSNTDIGQNLIDLITASTQYRGGTRVITAVQQLLDELLNLRR
jgi:flagellar hook protein FlgE